jgi:HEPN domain-containing protein
MQQARSDLKAARGSVSTESYEWACFQSQQAAEKALKAFWHHNQAEPSGHSLVRLMQDYPNEPDHSQLMALIDHSKQLDKLYIPTRYPDGLPDLTPSEVFSEADASTAIDHAWLIIEWVARKLEE